MKRKRPFKGFTAALTLILSLALVLGAGFRQPAQAGTEDAAMFYQELAQYGEWVDYENYGPVWHPTQVDPEWRPYVNGRWVPTEQGQVFETQEPWGWATYHYCNWMPTTSYGWVWVPGRTWYPSTVDWRTTPEDTPKEAAYVGWAPIPPPNYVPPPIPAYEPAGGYFPGSPVADLITAPFYVFAEAASFLLGLGQAMTPSYTYVGAGILAPPVYVPAFLPQTVLVPNYVTPAYYPPMSLIGLGATAAASVAMIVPRRVLGGRGYVAPSDKLNVAGIGCGGQGGGDLSRMEKENIVALCDADWTRAAKMFAKHPQAPRYKDFRVMLEKHKDIDAVTVGTPDHFHAVAAMAAIQLGKHVFVEKPDRKSVV